MFIISQLDIQKLTVQIFGVHENHQESLNYLFEQLKKMDNIVSKICDAKIKVFKINTGMIYNNRTHIYTFQILECDCP